VEEIQFMKRSILFLTMLALLALLVACGGNAAVENVVQNVVEEAAPAQVVVEEPVVEEPVVEEPVVEEPVVEEVVAAGPEALDAALGAFIGSMQGYNALDLETLNTMLVENPPFLLDVRTVEEVEKNGHIEGSILIPHVELLDNLDKLPSYGTPLVVYCGSGWRCTIAMPALGALGWSNIYSLKGGSFGGWVEAGYPIVEGLPAEAAVLNAETPDPALVEALRPAIANLTSGYGGISPADLNVALVDDAGLQIMDVRMPDEIEKNGYIEAENSIAIPLEELITRRAEWPADTVAPLVIYCGTGHRSTIAMSILNAYGYTNVRSMQGGLNAWAAADLPVAGAAAVNLDDAFDTFLAAMEGYGVITLEDVNMALAEDPPPFLLDVREAAEIEANGHIESAIHIPIRELAQHIDLLPSFDTPIIVYCGSGWRSTVAYAVLETLGWENVTTMKGGGYGGWVAAGYPTVEGLPADALVLDVADPDALLVAEMDKMLQALPDGWGTVRADDLNLALVDDPDIVLIDVRKPGELADNGVIESENLVNIPLEELMAQKELWPDPEAKVVVYCGTGHRSIIAMSILRAYGYKNITSLVNGLGAWTEAGFPVVEYAGS
jgi:rhodanese-related sulfurtransferase